MPHHKRTPIETIQIASHPNRWSILQALTKPMGTQEIANATGMSQHLVVWHGRELRKHGLVSVKRDKALPTRLIYTRTPFLAEVVVDYEENGTEVTFTPRSRKA